MTPEYLLVFMPLHKIFAFIACALLASTAWAQGGGLVLSGKYQYRTDAHSLEQLGKQICFFPKEAATIRSVRLPDDDRAVWFCFANTQDAARQLVLKLEHALGCGMQGYARIVISAYRTAKPDTDDNDVATLARVLRRSEPQAIVCKH